jgi:hypothetical protein
VESQVQGRTPVLVAVVGAVALEAGLLLGVTVFYAARLLGQGAAEAGAATATSLLSALVGAFLLLCARGLWQGRRWARAPVVTWQLLQLTVALPAATGPRWWLGAGLVLLSVVAAGGLFVPSVVRQTTGRAEPPVT